MTAVQKALQLFQSNRFEEATKGLKKHLKKNPSDLQALSLMGDIDVKRGNFAKAKDSLEKILSYVPNNTDVLNKLSYIYDKLDLKHKALKCLSRSVEISPRDARAHYAMACIYKENKDYEKAKEHYKKSLSINPKSREAYNNLANILGEEGNFDEAQDCLVKAIEIDPSYFVAHINVGRLFIKAGEFHKAIESLQKTVDLSPDSEDAHYFLATGLYEAGHYDKGIKHFLAALKINPSHKQAMLRLATLYMQIGWFDKGTALCMKLLDDEPNMVEANVCLAGAHILRSDYEKAYELIEPFTKLNIIPGQVLSIYTKICLHHKKDQEKAIDLLENFKSSPDQNLPEYQAIHFGLGSLYESIGNFKKAFFNYKKANDSKAKSDLVNTTREKLRGIIEVYDSDFVTSNPYKGHESEAPVFIIGMPRTGTSLVEQIIASHPDAYGAGELVYMGSALRGLISMSDDYPACMRHISPSILEGIANGYIRHIRTLAGNERLVIDKMPLNYHHLGFIKVLFPKSKIIHCKRNPLDTCLSCYLMDFGGKQPYSNNLEDLGEYYKLYLRQMQHWKETVNIPMMDIQYEDMVNNQEEMSRKLISYCGLDWNDACLNFHKHKRVTLTASNQQVNKPIYNKSVERWKNYEEYLTPLINALKQTD